MLPSRACRPCSPGFANALTGQTECQRCPEGEVTYNFGERQCLPEGDRLLYDPIVGCSNYVNDTLTVGVQQVEVSANFTINRWSPTFEGTLNAYMNRFKCFFQMKSMRLEELAVAVKNGSVQFAFTDSGVYAQYNQRYQAKAIATVVRYYDGRAYKQQGGVIFRLTDKHTDIFNLSQITMERNLTVCPTDKESFAGWNVQRYEFFKQGIDVNKVFGRIVFSGGHTESVHMVASGACDIGFARTYSIRILINNGIYPPGTFTIINERFHSGFILESSSALYSEWAFTVMNGVPEDVSNNAIIPLFGMREFDAASMTGLHAGFVPPRNYAVEENVYFDLDLMNNETHVCAPGRERDNTKPLKPCKDCDAGRYSFDGIGACRPCSPGFANALTGQTECQRCPEGQVTYNFGERQCLPEQDRLLYDPIVGCSNYVKNTLTVGVQQAEVSANFTINRWSPTFEETLNTYMNRFKCFFQMKSMRLEELAVAVKNGSVQFAFTDSGVYAQYNQRYQAKVIASVVRYYDGRAYKRQGGVIFRLTDKHTDIKNLSQITKERNLTGIDVNEVVGRIMFSGGHTESVHMVASGACDIGFARTYSIRILINNGIYPPGTFTIINERFHSGFTLQSSSALYSEWARTARPSALVLSSQKIVRKNFVSGRQNLGLLLVEPHSTSRRGTIRKGENSESSAVTMFREGLLVLFLAGVDAILFNCKTAVYQKDLSVWLDKKGENVESYAVETFALRVLKELSLHPLLITATRAQNAQSPDAHVSLLQLVKCQQGPDCIGQPLTTRKECTLHSYYSPQLTHATRPRMHKQLVHATRAQNAQVSYYTPHMINATRHQNAHVSLIESTVVNASRAQNVQVSLL
eukprot:g45553.t1